MRELIAAAILIALVLILASPWIREDIKRQNECQAKGGVSVVANRQILCFRKDVLL